ncbi:MAG TPA: transketolase C-terminal domain-containing protein [Gemmatimonadaceae bacterium]|nr:transketolase C-terminal domain-containing protein [Gemmatimonadaceae bacterium]
MTGTLSHEAAADASQVNPRFDWKRIAYLLLASRGLDDMEETRLLPEKKVVYQFSARGHDLAQIILGSLLDGRHDAAGAYYRSRPLLLTLGLSIEDAFAGPLRKSGGFSDGRDIGVVCNLPNRDGPVVLPMSGDVGSQYTPTAGWAQAITYHRDVLGDRSYDGAMAVVLGGEASVATNGFWSALTIATTLQLPILFYIEDNRYGISVPSDFQTPGGNIAANLASFRNLYIREGDGTDPGETAALFEEVTAYVRDGKGPALLRLEVPRLCGHSGQDTQAYKTEDCIADEKARDPLPKLRRYLVPALMTAAEWTELEAEVARDVNEALERALARPEPDVSRITRYRFAEGDEVQQVGGLAPGGHRFPTATANPSPEAQRTNMLTAIRRTLEHELRTNPRLLVFGEDIGPKGGVHAATMGLQEAFGDKRVFDTSLSEEGIIGRAVGMAIAGLMPVAEIQFRKYADPATEQLNNCGTIRWRTANRFAAPIVVRMPGGFAKVGDPWHSVSGEVVWAHAIGWQMAFPSNAEDAVGLLRSALRSNNPTIFFEHRHLLDGPWARRPYPGDDYVLPFGKAKITQAGDALTVVTWGAMVERCELAAKAVGESVEIIDLRTISPWDKETVLASVARTRRCLVVHEDGITAGFGAEVAATAAEKAFFSLDAPISRLAIPDVPVPHNFGLMDAVVPTVESIASRITEVLEA